MIFFLYDQHVNVNMILTTLIINRCKNSYQNLDFWGYCLEPYSTLFELVFDTRVNSLSKLAYALASMHILGVILGVLDDAPSSSVASWHFSILGLMWSDRCHLRVAPCQSRLLRLLSGALLDPLWACLWHSCRLSLEISVCLSFNAHSWCIGWCTVLLCRIMTLLNLGTRGRIDVTWGSPLVCLVWRSQSTSCH